MEMTSASLRAGVYDFVRRQVSANSDPRVGSARDGANSTSALKVGVSPTNSSSFATLFMTFLPTAIYAVVCITIFVCLRGRYPRVYSPRTFLGSLDSQIYAKYHSDRSPELPNGWFNWIKPFCQTPDEVVLNHSSLDGYLFLRYIKILCTICVFGVLLTWPILLPFHAYGGNGLLQLDKVTFGNVKDPKWLYMHACIAWIFFGFILYMISRECVYFISLRQAYIVSPLYANRLSSRTVLFTCVPRQILDARKLRRVFGDSVKNVWIPQETEELDQLVKERDQTANRLEKAEIQLIKTANAAYQKAIKKGLADVVQGRTSSESGHSKEMDDIATEASKNSNPSPPMSPMVTISPHTPRSMQDSIPTDGTPILKNVYGDKGPSYDLNGSIAAQWIPHSDRPVHRPIANYGRRVDTIKWTRTRLKKLGPEIGKLRNMYRKGRGIPIPAVFIEFQTQVDAQSAYQTLAHHRANHMRPEIVGVRPEEIYWPALSMPWWERIGRRFMIQAFVAVMVIFFSLPAALVGIISNIKFLSDKVFFLKWIEKLPSIILGLISGLLPAVALAMLMAIVPGIMRACARQAGVPTESRIELFVQSAYFVFQIVQVFLVTTLTSAVSGAITEIIKNPLGIRQLLAQSLPKASNFYVSYFILQGLAMSANRMVHLSSLWRHVLLGHVGASPRARSARYDRLRKIHWGSVYPVFTNMGVIAISYSLIAPIVLGVAAIGLFLVYLTYRYNLLYVYSSERDTRGLHYPRALTQTLTGVYLAEICLVGLFGVQGGYGPLVMTFGLLLFTSLIHISLNDALGPLVFNLPRTVAAEEALRIAGNHPVDASNLTDKIDAFEGAYDAEQQQDAGYNSDFDPSDPVGQVSHGTQNSRGVKDVEGVDNAVKLTTTTAGGYLRKKYTASPLPALIKAVDFWTYWITPDPTITPNMLMKFLHPEIFQDYHILRQQLPEDIPEYIYEESVLKDAYNPPSMRKRSPRLWIPRDIAGISRQEVAHSGKVIEITDQDAWLNEKGGVDVELDGESSRWVVRDWERVKF